MQQAANSISVDISYCPPFPVQEMFGFLAARAVKGVEEGDRHYYRRALTLAHGAGVVTVRADGLRALSCTFLLDDARDLAAAVLKVERLFDTGADPLAIGEVLGADRLIGHEVMSQPGRRVPGHVDGNELAIRAILGQQVSIDAARTITTRLSSRHGRQLATPVGTVCQEFPSAAAIAALRADEVPIPRARARALVALAGALTDGLRLDPPADNDAVEEQLLAIAGIGPWTVAYVRMRALGDRDAFMASDLGVRRALEQLGRYGGLRQVRDLAEGWRPYRAYALQYLWSIASRAR
ncbi:MAG: DNA-3-methyladenine glycosylase family protein [Acidimicrobiales bacterium]